MKPLKLNESVTIEDRNGCIAVRGMAIHDCDWSFWVSEDSWGVFFIAPDKSKSWWDYNEGHPADWHKGFYESVCRAQNNTASENDKGVILSVLAFWKSNIETRISKNVDDDAQRYYTRVAWQKEVNPIVGPG